MKMEHYESCVLCPRRCGVNRYETTGYCGVGATLRAAKAYLHMWEEPCISGERGSGTVFFSGCSLKCVYCQNSDIATGGAGFEIDARRLSEVFLELQNKGAHNINLVTPTHYAAHIIKAIDLTRGRLNIPIIYNCGGYESVETLKLLDGYIDIYLPDFKYMDKSLATKYSSAPDYPQICMAAIEEMTRQTMRQNEFDSDGMMRRGVIVRHLVLPGETDNSKAVIEYLYNTYGNDIYMSIMNQYTPLPQVKAYPEIDRSVSDAEYDEVLDYAVALGVENAFVQEGGAVSESFIPSFDGEGII
ncbi:MAG: radical SAM protein [Clostridia bacterium]|nr:radical SAM protein [Clostridia bacterium]